MRIEKFMLFERDMIWGVITSFDSVMQGIFDSSAHGICIL